MAGYLIAGLCLALLLALSMSADAGAETREGIANRVEEWTFVSHKTYADPFNEVQVDVVFSAPDGRQLRVPAFWAGGQTWRARYASHQIGTHRFRTECTDPQNPDLHNVRGEIHIKPYDGNNPLYRHGSVRVASDRRHFEYADGTPFFWQGDTWWMGLCSRLHWPDEFHTLTEDRVKKGFTVIQIVAGLYPDMGAFDERGANEAGFPWTKDYGRIEPAYFDAADRRIAHLVESGLSPCIVGAWGYHLPWLGEERMKQHWRYVIARYGAYPVFWCVAGEANLPWYLAKDFPYDDREQVKGWTKIARYVRQTDPFHRPTSIHPTGLGRLTARGAVDDESLLDFDMLQTGHGDRSSLAPTIETIRKSYAATPVMPVLDSEVCYEGILDTCHADVQRLMFWTCMLSGAAGHTYGANGIWQLNRRDQPYGNSPHGGTYGPTPWDNAMQLPGSAQIGFGKRLLEKFAWQRFQPHPEWVSYAEVHLTGVVNPFMAPYCAGIPGQVRILYLPLGARVTVRAVEHEVNYQASWFDPITGDESPAGTASGGERGDWTSAPPPNSEQDWVLVLHNEK
jgi:hypothetical protein